MTGELLAAASALWLGVLTSVSPCPLATNIAATTLLARRMGNVHWAFGGIAAYTLGRVAAYVALAGILFLGLVSMPALSAFLRHELLPLVGPILILAGLTLMGWLPLPINIRAGSVGAAGRLSRMGIVGDFALGGLFAMSFCPVSAALFFGSLIPLAATSSLSLWAVVIYGIGTALPVGILAGIALYSAARAGNILGRIQKLQSRATGLTGWVIVLVGVWLTLSDTLDLF